MARVPQRRRRIADLSAPDRPGWLSPVQVARLALRYWEGEDAVRAFRIMWGESRGNPRAVNVNTSGSKDRGIWQWNNAAWPSIDDDTAFNPDAATLRAYQQTSTGRTGWRPWFGPSNYHEEWDAFARDVIRQVGGRSSTSGGGGLLLALLLGWSILRSRR